MYARTVPGPEKQPQLREFLDKPDTPLYIRVAPREKKKERKKEGERKEKEKREEKKRKKT